MAEDEPGGGGIDTTSPEFKAAAEKWLEDQGIHKALSAEREARKKLEKQWDGLDPDEVRQLLKELEEAEKEEAQEQGDHERLLEQERTRFANELKARDDKMAGLQKSLEAALIDSAAAKAISKYEGDAELLLPHVRSATKLMEVNGKHVAVVLDDSGQPRLAPDAKTATDYMGIEHLVGGWREAGKFAGAFAGTGASGGGASASTRAGGSGTPRRVSLDEAARMDPGELKKGIDTGALQVT